MSLNPFSKEEIYSDLNPKLYVHRSRVINNFNYVKSKNPKSKLYAVLKANAYGMGLVNMGSILTDLVDGFGVARLVEAFTLRDVTPQHIPIMILSGVHTDSALNYCFYYNFFPIIGNEHQLDSYLKLAKDNLSRQERLLFLKINTGMHRSGFSENQCEDIITRIRQDGIENICLVMHPHLALHDDYAEYTLMQLNSIEALAQRHSCHFSAANSPAALLYHQYNLGNIIRIGTALYGYEIKDEQLQQIFSLVAHVINIVEVAAGQSVGYNQSWRAKQDSKIMVLNFGYADGLAQAVNKGYVLIENKKCLIITLTMDAMFVDITEISEDIKLHQEIELFGDVLSAQKFAESLNCSVDQLITQLSSFRIKREVI